MLMPSIFRENLWNDWMDDPFAEMDGENVKQEEIHAKFEDGVLQLRIPRMDARKQVEENHYVTIE
ncbi:MAG: Hsp20 family protein [Clostridiales bacterium]|nr:Hsp20 family protein [Clostridiales bacterium]